MPLHANVCRAADKKLRLHVRELYPAQTDVLAALDNARALYGRIGIDIEIASAMCVATSAGDFARLSVIDGQCKWDQENAEQTDLHRVAGMGSGSGVVAFFVRSIQTDSGSLNGCAGHLPERPAVVLGAGCTPWTLAHELGHVLLGPKFDPVHTEERDNLMYKRSSSFTRFSNPTLTDAQVERMRASRYVQSSLLH